jgi:carbonic anhydrase/acetyltransferase-like protein (isoleucine patch superfamily)
MKYIDPRAVILGNVEIGENSSIWPGAVLRGDGKIRIGCFTNIQENCVVHAPEGTKTIIGNHVTICHGAIIHACTIEDEVLISMGAIIMDGATIGKNAIVDAGALVTEGKKIPSGVLIHGVPGKIVRELRKSEIDYIRGCAILYAKKAEKYEGRSCGFEV